MNVGNFLLNHTPLLYFTQSLWRDEAFSVWIANGSLIDTITRTSQDFNPPLYYLILNLWMKIFGTSEVMLRSLSLVFFIITLAVVYKFSLKLLKNKSAALNTTLLALFNPMLFYFAFELRMYSLLVLFTILSTYFLYDKNWLGFILAAVGGLYTQPFMAFVVFGQAMYLILTKRLVLTIKLLITIGILFLPWAFVMLEQFRHSGPMWMYKVDLNTIFSVLGNIFIGYEGTPGNLWNLMKLLSLIILSVSIYVWRKKSQRAHILLFYCLTYLPLVLVLAISQLKPIYVHRYVIFATLGEIFLLSIFLHQLKKPVVTKTVIVLLILANFAAVSFHRKVNFGQTFARITPQLNNSDLVYAETPLSYYESWYYTPENYPVYLYNPQFIEPPRFVGSVGMPKEVWTTSFPLFPQKAFLIKENGEYTIISVLIGQNYE